MESYCTVFSSKNECNFNCDCEGCAYKIEVNPEMTIFRFSEISRILTGNRTAIRKNYDGNKYIEAIEELRDFESEWIAKHKTADKP